MEDSPHFRIASQLAPRPDLALPPTIRDRLPFRIDDFFGDLVAACHLGELSAPTGQWPAPMANRVLERVLASSGFVRVQCGGLRTTFVHRDEEWVLKCPQHTLGLSATQFEFDRLSERRPLDVLHLPETYDLGDGIMLQRYYRVDEDRATADRIALSALSFSLDCHDFQPYNVGYSPEGHPVFFDFSPCEFDDDDDDVYVDA